MGPRRASCKRWESKEALNKNHNPNSKHISAVWHLHWQQVCLPWKHEHMITTNMEKTIPTFVLYSSLAAFSSSSHSFSSRSWWYPLTRQQICSIWDVPSFWFHLRFCMGRKSIALIDSCVDQDQETSLLSASLFAFCWASMCPLSKEVSYSLYSYLSARLAVWLSSWWPTFQAESVEFQSYLRRFGGALRTSGNCATLDMLL